MRKRGLVHKFARRSPERLCPSASLGGSNSAWDEAWDKLSADEIQEWTRRGGPPTPLLVRTFLESELFASVTSALLYVLFLSLFDGAFKVVY